ncbi:hypothetical protein Leryth_006820, partial [Lithospermum erythrorhizon]
LHSTLLGADPKPLLSIPPPFEIVDLSEGEEPYKEVWGWDEYEDKRKREFKPSWVFKSPFDKPIYEAEVDERAKIVATYA